MNKVTASKSAAIIAAHRAIESAKPPDQRICFDPFAEKLIPEKTTVIGETEIPKEQALNIFKQFVPGFHEYFLARTRYIDDCLTCALQDGLQQLVILGAGYDSRAYRFELRRQNISVFEVDHPATQSDKKERLMKIFSILPEHVRFIPADLGSEDLGKKLHKNGYDEQLKTLFIWEGVTMYLDPQAVDQVLDFIVANSGPGSCLIFDFTSSDVVQGNDTRPEAMAWRKKTSESGEPLKFGIDFENPASFLEKRNFSTIDIATHEYFNRAYYSAPEDNRRATPILAIAHCSK